MALVIKKTVNLDSLGEEYSGIVLEFKSIPASDVAKFSKEVPSEDDLDGTVTFFLQVLKSNFVSGKQGNESVNADDLSLLDIEALMFVFKILTGQDIDPKSGNELTSSSTTESAEA